jgi:ABC-type antimicrobial peptide transport system permease subunit
MKKLIENIRDTATKTAIIVLLIVLFLMAVIYMNYILSRKYEIALLQANGMAKKELFKLIFTEIAYVVEWDVRECK